MGYWPTAESGPEFPTYVAGGAASGTTAHVKSAWAQLHAGIPYDVQGLHIRAGSLGLDNADYFGLVDIGAGPSGSEQVLVPNLLMSSINSTSRPAPSGMFNGFTLPLRIPKGTRLVTRHQHTVAGARTASLNVSLLGGGFRGQRGLSKWEAYGPNTGTSRASGITVPAGAGTYSAWTQLTAATTRHHTMLMMMLSPNVWAADASLIIQLGIGASGSERTLYSRTITVRPTSTATVYSANMPYSVEGPFPCNIPKGSRLAWRLQFVGGGAGDILHAAVYGGY